MVNMDVHGYKFLMQLECKGELIDLLSCCNYAMANKYLVYGNINHAN